MKLLLFYQLWYSNGFLPFLSAASKLINKGNYRRVVIKFNVPSDLSRYRNNDWGTFILLVVGAGLIHSNIYDSLVTKLGRDWIFIQSRINSVMDFGWNLKILVIIRLQKIARYLGNQCPGSSNTKCDFVLANRTLKYIYQINFTAQTPVIECINSTVATPAYRVLDDSQSNHPGWSSIKPNVFDCHRFRLF